MVWSDITGALGNVWDVVTACMTQIKDNALLMAMFSASIIPVGFKIFKRAKRAVK